MLNGQFTGGEFLLSQRGAGAEAHTAAAFVRYLPVLGEGVAQQPGAINGIASQPFLSGDGALRFTVDFRSAPSPLRKGWLAMPLMAPDCWATPSLSTGR